MYVLCEFNKVMHIISRSGRFSDGGERTRTENPVCTNEAVFQFLYKNRDLGRVDSKIETFSRYFCQEHSSGDEIGNGMYGVPDEIIEIQTGEQRQDLVRKMEEEAEKWSDLVLF